LVLAASSALMASNMGFKLTYGMISTGNYQLNWVGLPYYWGTAATANSVCADIGANAAEVHHWIRGVGNEKYESFLCGVGGTDFTINPGEAYLVKVSAATNWVIVGSHNPSLMVNLTSAGNYQLNWVSVPYHSTRTNASGLCTDVGANASEVHHWIRGAGNEKYESYLCGVGGTDFTLVPGEGVLIKVTAATSWTPSHY
jgi:hypothetical protein